MSSRAGADERALEAVVPRVSERGVHQRRESFACFGEIRVRSTPQQQAQRRLSGSGQQPVAKIATNTQRIPAQHAEA